MGNLEKLLRTGENEITEPERGWGEGPEASFLVARHLDSGICWGFQSPRRALAARMLIFAGRVPFIGTLDHSVLGTPPGGTALLCPAGQQCRRTNKEIMGRDPEPRAKPCQSLVFRNTGGHRPGPARGQGAGQHSPIPRPHSMASLPPGANPQSHTQLGGVLSLSHSKLCPVGCSPPSRADGGPDGGLRAPGEPAFEK